MDYVPDPRWKTDGDYAAKLSAIFNGYDDFTDMEEDDYFDDLKDLD